MDHLAPIAVWILSSVLQLGIEDIGQYIPDFIDMPYSILSRVSRQVQIPPTVNELPMVNFAHNGLDWSAYTLSGDRSASQHQNKEPDGTMNGHVLCEQTPSTTSPISVASFDHNGLDWSQYTLSGNQSSPQNQNDELAGTTIGDASCEQDPPTASAMSSNSTDYFHCQSYFDCAPITQGGVGKDMGIPSLPPYLTPLPTSLDKTVLQFLSSNGALSVPSAEFRHICASRYLELLHPLFPLLDLHNLLTITQRGNDECGTISLLLFNAVMCAALAFVENDHVIRAGYPSKRAARMSFFRRAKVCYSNTVDIKCSLIILYSFFMILTRNQIDSFQFKQLCF